MTYTVRCKECNPRKEWDVEMSPGDLTPKCKCGRRTTKVMLPCPAIYRDGGTGARKEG